MARTSTPWRLLPVRELGCGSPATCRRRLNEWAKAGVFEALHLEVLDRLGEQGGLDWSRASVDTMSVRARRGGIMWAQIRSIVASLGASSTWSATVAAAADRRGDRRQRHRHHDVPGGHGRHPAGAHAVGAAAHPDRARSTPTRAMTARPTVPICVAVGSTRGSLGVGSNHQRGWGATDGGSSGRCQWLSCFRRLQVRWDRDSGRFFAFVLVACAVICCNRL